MSAIAWERLLIRNSSPPALCGAPGGKPRVCATRDFADPWCDPRIGIQSEFRVNQKSYMDTQIIID
jgi:hypothetical protein